MSTGETIRDSLSFIEKLNSKEIVELENAIDEALEAIVTCTGEEIVRRVEREAVAHKDGGLIMIPAYKVFEHITSVTGVE